MIICIYLPHFLAEIYQSQSANLQDKPFVIVDYGQERPKILAVSMALSTVGITSDMSLSKARLIYPDLLSLPFDKGRYDEAMLSLLEILSLFTDRLETDTTHWQTASQIVYLDLGKLNIQALKGMVKGIARALVTYLKLTASIGAATGMFPAFVASLNTPGGTTRWIRPGDEAKFLMMQPIKFLSIHPAVLERLHLFGVSTLGAYARLPRPALYARFGDEGLRLLDLARGKDLRQVARYQPPRMALISKQLQPPIEDRLQMSSVVSTLAQALILELDRDGLVSQDFSLSMTLDDKTSLVESLETRMPVSRASLLAEKLAHRIDRLPFTAGVTELTLYARNAEVVKPQQLDLFSTATKDVDELLIAISERSWGQVYQARLNEPSAHLPDQRFYLKRIS